jgi:hypothetical protein
LLQAALEMELIQRLQRKQKEQVQAYQQLEAALGLSKAARYETPFDIGYNEQAASLA